MASTIKPFVDNAPGNPNNLVIADDVNGFKNENNNLIEKSDQALSTADNDQTTKAVSIYAAGGDFYTDSGAADVYVLDLVGAKIAPPVYFVGFRARFEPGFTNTGASTVNVATLGVKNIKVRDDGGPKRDPVAGEIMADVQIELYYDGTDFIIGNPKIGLANSWVTFEVLESPPGNIVLHTNYNISSVVEVSVGLYDVTFSNAFVTSEDKIVAVGNVVIKDEAINSGGNDNLIIFKLTSSTVIRVNVYDQGIDANERPERVSLVFYGVE